MSAALSEILAHRLIGIIRMKRYHHAVEIAESLARGGLTVLEYTMSGEGAIDCVAEVRATLGERVCVGAGTVLDAAAAEAAIAAGARFLVTPAVVPDVIEVGRRRNVPVICGALTPTEVLAATRAGADLVKIFPARLGGPAYIRDLLGPFPQMKFVATGGISAENARAYLDAGAVAVAVGGNLVSEQAVNEGRWAAIEANARDCVEAVK
ncbi:MAG: bifunctional 4-hydroxy-2-oxoglutarate aldolase/2-dehydro-3-deoxy-phosphogluconate aldolase [Caldilinea sp.]|nr:bifunctional 4-hydroxy-2-oxoglutarate aldolase/2-dehydro-3-deoxy-phosphogluconate aldolase [Caldilinea sp.]MCB9116275.1 bifunctional 4-hydroxy-2-oxoglutarate aldolase/2-dehydro-3-deoxy-phosphogluconate aldolase [Caldilineaceae bacterium]MCB9122118.1 bifunctional 4-hydroxy-2-oxoglutarate aldolase/2-dehydro-3-deoxy-phosphogluconate aldolase [Caldilineaceae bacterium]MCO5208805.1 bifunctional 4-hydroxy-2-oxoglutarate aldolase/2-dehydro-3-deoxy-phosphogluconate aldolase [Caldilinea sp.]MCW584110